MKNVLIMTSTVIPPSEVRDLSRTDPKERLEDYKKALKFYCSELGREDKAFEYIIFCDNSLADLSELKQIAEDYKVNGRVEFLSFYGLDYEAHRGRGYGEFKLMDYIIDNSQVISSLNKSVKDYDSIKYWKVSGRYIIKNIRQMIFFAPRNLDVYMNIKHFSFVRKWRFLPQLKAANWVEIYFYGFTLKGYHKYFYNLYKILGDKGYKNKCAEYQLFPLLKDKAKADPTFYFRFRTLPNLWCIKGFTNKETKRNNWRNFIYGNIRRSLELFKIYV